MFAQRFPWNRGRSNLRYGLALGALFGGVACGPPGPYHPTPSSAAAPNPTSLAPVTAVRFVLAVDGQPAGTEVWNVATAPDGAVSIEFDASVETPHGKMRGSGRYAILPNHFPDEAEITVNPPGSPASTFRLERTGSDLKMKLQGGGRDDELKAGRPSNVFEPRPFFVGLAPVCSLLLDKSSPPLVEFPGSVIRVLEKKAVSGTSVFFLDHGGLGRTIVACNGSDLVAALDPWTGQSAVREGNEAIGQELIKSIERTKPVTPADLVEEDVSVASGDATLACSFLKPNPGTQAKQETAAATKRLSNTKLPAVLFSTGSGPEDRDDDSIGRGGLKVSLFKVIAIALAQNGIASLRCDDRGTAKSTGAFDTATLETFVHDAEAALHALRERKDIDPARIGFIGHSEGAVVGALVASDKNKLTALMFMAGPSRPLPEIGLEQEETFLKGSGLPPEQIERQLDAQRQVMNAIRTGKPLPEEIHSPQRDAIEKQRPWLKSHFESDLGLALRRIPKTSVFVVQGGKDVQIPPTEAERIKKALAAGKNGDALVKVYPDLNHVFSVSHGGGVTEYSDASARVDEGFLGDTVAFFTQALKSGDSMTSSRTPPTSGSSAP